MEETLGKRITAHRKRLGMTQDKLAEQLGITAQAVSKWENDQSCPDITMLPKLAEIFGISIDQLLGQSENDPVHESEVVDQEHNTDDGSLRFQKGNWELSLGGSRRSAIGMSLWVILVGTLLLAGNIFHLNVDLWEVLWPAGLLVFGLFGLFSRFSILRLGCLLFGAYFLLNAFDIRPFSMSKEYLLPAFLLLFGLHLLVDAIKKPSRRHCSILHNGQSPRRGHCNVREDHFECNSSFGENTYLIDTPRLQAGEINVSFGELTVDLSGCEEIAPGCVIDASCSFGELVIKVPGRYHVTADTSTFFADFTVKGTPDTEAEAVITLNVSASFGEICLIYI